MATLYEKQMLWRKAAQMKAEQTSSKSDTVKDCTFTPTIFTAVPPGKAFEAPVREANEVSTQRHVNRQATARKEKQQMEDKLYGKSRRQPPMSPKTIGLASAYAPTSSTREKSDSGAGSEFDSPASEKKPAKLRMHHEPLGDLGDLSNEEELTIVEVLERERRQWHAERIKLIHCIHLQQLELTASSSAAQERASSIAKEFARAIEGFEERLVNMESNVQKELMAIKTIASQLTGVGGTRI